MEEEERNEALKMCWQMALFTAIFCVRGLYLKTKTSKYGCSEFLKQRVQDVAIYSNNGTS
jgi:hypothetical protein